MAELLYTRQQDFSSRFSRLLTNKSEFSSVVNETVSQIINKVAAEGDKALIAFSKAFDHYHIQEAIELRVTEDAVKQAYASCDKAVIEALHLAKDRIQTYHQKQMPSSFEYTDSIGVTLGNHWSPIEAVGIYVPGGKAVYPSSVLMNAVPALVAGVERIVMVVPAPEGILNPVVLAAAHIVGIKEIYKVGGAQAVAALAIGTETIRRVYKVVGPGNSYVAAAKRQLFGQIGIDMIAGPSEILVVADAHNNPAWIAADLLSQAEHDELAKSILITEDEAFAKAVIQAVEAMLPRLSKEAIARSSWEKQGMVIVSDHPKTTLELINKIAAEHVELAVESPKILAGQIKNAGAIFLGRYTPEAIGDYMAGPSHVLPTSGTAAFSSGLSVFDFLKRMSVIGCSKESFFTLSNQTATLAHAEGLTAHALSVEIRRDK